MLNRYSQLTTGRIANTVPFCLHRFVAIGWILFENYILASLKIYYLRYLSIELSEEMSKNFTQKLEFIFQHSKF